MHNVAPRCCGKMTVYERYYFPKTRCIRLFYKCNNCKRQMVVVKPKLNVWRLINGKIDYIKNFKSERLEKSNPLFKLALTTPESFGILV